MDKLQIRKKEKKIFLAFNSRQSITPDIVLKKRSRETRNPKRNLISYPYITNICKHIDFGAVIILDLVVVEGREILHPFTRSIYFRKGASARYVILIISSRG